MTIHEDDRRIIYDWAGGVYESLKMVIVKEEIPIGDHFHIYKDEVFFLGYGRIKELVLGEEKTYNIDAPFFINVPRGLYHKFTCEIGSVIFGGATALFDENDEIKL